MTPPMSWMKVMVTQISSVETKVPLTREKTSNPNIRDTLTCNAIQTHGYQTPLVRLPAYHTCFGAAQITSVTAATTAKSLGDGIL